MRGDDLQDIDKIRSEIRDIDREISSLFTSRMKKVEGVARYKYLNSKNVYNRAVENANMQFMLSQVPSEIREYMYPVYQSIMDVSKSFQLSVVSPKVPYIDEITDACNNRFKKFPLSLNIACQGEEGAYSQIASDKFFSSPVIEYFSTFKGVFDAVNNGKCEYGVLPIENSTAGSVSEIYDLMQNYKFYIIRSLRLKINHNLLVKKSVKSIDTIRKIYSHPQAIAQCKGFLNNLAGVEILPFSNTAAAAKMVSLSENDDVAAISSYDCAKIYSLNPIAKDIQDFDNNFTRFICISKTLKISQDANKSSFMMILPHTPGSLYKVLSTFYCLGINLNKIESRALANRNFEFMFYFDVDMIVEKEQFSKLLNMLEGQVESLVYLGSYREIV